MTLIGHVRRGLSPDCRGFSINAPVAHQSANKIGNVSRFSCAVLMAAWSEFTLHRRHPAALVNKDSTVTVGTMASARRLNRRPPEPIIHPPWLCHAPTEKWRALGLSKSSLVGSWIKRELVVSLMYESLPE